MIPQKTKFNIEYLNSGESLTDDATVQPALRDDIHGHLGVWIKGVMVEIGLEGPDARGECNTWAAWLQGIGNPLLIFAFGEIPLLTASIPGFEDGWNLTNNLL